MRDTELVYMSGNGLVFGIYSYGDMLRFAGPPYSSPELLALTMPPELKNGRVEISHRPKAGIWDTFMRRDAGNAADAAAVKLTDFAPPDFPCVVRHVEAAGPVTMKLRGCRGSEAFHYEIPFDENRAEEGIFFKTRSGNYVYNDYPLPFPQFIRVLLRGDFAVRRVAPFEYEITVKSAADVIFCCGRDYPECVENAERIYGIDTAKLVADTVDYWGEIFRRAESHTERRIAADFPHREALLGAVEDTVINIIAQQSREGGVLAGGPFPLGYVRDQFGVTMCLLRLGLFEEARKVLRFYIDTFRSCGRVLNAQGLGVRGLFHFAENDCSEITGYLLLQFFRYLRATGDRELLTENADFLFWLCERQLSQLEKGMMPFNGDETYIAGGLLPRDVINEGSAEATALFILSGRALLDFMAAEGLAAQTFSAETLENALQAAERAYIGHFVPGGTYTLNCPGRLENASCGANAAVPAGRPVNASRSANQSLEPRFRIGVCLNHGRGDCDFFGWTERMPNGTYVCPKCAARGDIPARNKVASRLPSALLMPAYIGSDYPGDEYVRPYIEGILAKLLRDGHFYSREDRKQNIGYDYGLLLFNVIKYGLPGGGEIFRKLLALRDGVGAWSERYIDDEPEGARFRPWESAINLDAMVAFAEGFK